MLYALQPIFWHLPTTCLFNGLLYYNRFLQFHFSFRRFLIKHFKIIDKLKIRTFSKWLNEFWLIANLKCTHLCDIYDEEQLENLDNFDEKPANLHCGHFRLKGKTFAVAAKDFLRKDFLRFSSVIIHICRQ